MLSDTLKILKQGWYNKNGKKIELKLSLREMEKIQVYLPEDVQRNANQKDFKPCYSMGRCGYDCENMDSFELARRCGNSFEFSKGKQPEILVLNFANPIYPGGGVRRGAMAQEESLCLKSSLLLSLESDQAKKYYEYNKSLNTSMGSDALMITPYVEIIKDEKGKLLDNTVVVSVLTCAAPMKTKDLEGMTQQEYEKMIYDRIMSMLKCVAYLKYDNLILDAWGCGNFGNDAHIISDLFYRVLKDFDYNGRSESSIFHRIQFAVLDRTKDQYNFKEFCRNFSYDNFYRDENQKEIDEAMERIKKNEVHLDQIKGCMIGGAVGDALGYPLIFWNEEKIFNTYGEKGITEYKLDPETGKALISDDIRMMLFTANGMLFYDTRGSMRGIPESPMYFVADAYYDWLKTKEVSYKDFNKQHRGSFYISWLMDVPEMYSERKPESVCLSALKTRKKNRGDTDSFIKEPLNDSKGCGGIKRIAPYALFCDFNNSMKECDYEGGELAAITHCHSLGYMPAAVLVQIINRIVYSKKKRSLKNIVIEAKNTVANLFKTDKHIKVLVNIIDLAVELSENNETDLTNINRLGEGWEAQETLAIAIYCALRYQNDFSKGVITAVNHKGNSGSTGAVTGYILGALIGFDAIEEKWKKNLELYNIIMEMAVDLCHRCQMDEFSHYEDPAWTEKYIYVQWSNKASEKTEEEEDDDEDDDEEEEEKTQFIAVLGDITNDHGVQAIVNSAKKSLLGGGGLDGKIHQVAGKKLLEECRTLNGCRTGQAKITGAYNLPCEYVIHTAGPVWRGEKEKAKAYELLASCYKSCLEIALEKGIRTIAFPSISTGIYKFPLDQAAEIAVKTVKEFVAEHPEAFDMIKFVLFDDTTFKAYKDEIEHWENEIEFEEIGKFINSPDFYLMNRMFRDGRI